MQIVLLLIVLVFGVSSSLAAVYAGYYKDPAHPGKCVLNGLILSPGEVHNDTEKCEKTSCGKNSWTSYYSCGVYKLDNDCKFVGHKYPNSSYPVCCEHQIVCNNMGEELGTKIL